MEKECCKEFHNKKCDWSISEVCDCPCHQPTNKVNKFGIVNCIKCGEDIRKCKCKDGGVRIIA